MATFDKHVKQPKVILVGQSNYLVFKSDFSDYAYAADVGDIYEGTREPGAQGYRSDHSKLKNALKNCISEKIKLSMLANLPADATVHQTCQWLEVKYGVNDSETNKDLILDHIKALKLKDFKNLEEFNASMDSLFTKYLAAGGQLTDEDRKKHILRGASSVFDVECKTLRSIPDLALRRTMSTLETAELEMTLESLSVDKGTTEVNAVRSSGQEAGKFMCFCCLNPEHGFRNCPFARGNGKFCLYCLKTNHWSSDCASKTCVSMNAISEVKSDHDDDDSSFRYVF